MPNKKERDSDTEETSERPSGSESDDDSDPEDHKGAIKKQQTAASSSEESDISDASDDESETDTKQKSDTKKSSNSKDADISLKKANEPSGKTAKKSSSKKDVKNEKQDDKKVTIQESASNERKTNKSFRESYGTLREKRKNKKLREAKDKEGIIFKKGNISRKWEKKYLIVSSGSRTIYIYDLEPEQNQRRANQAPKQVIALDTAVIYARVQRRGAEMQSYFNIRANNRDYLFKATTPEEKTKWVAAIKTNKKNKEEDQAAPMIGVSFQTPESQKKQDKHIEKASNIFMKLFGRESYLGVAKDS